MNYTALSFAVLITFNSFGQNTYYVDISSGSDANPCTSGSPCLTIQYVHDNHITNGNNDTIMIAGNATNYTETNISITKSNLHIIGPESAPSAVFDGSGGGTTSRCFHISAPGVSLRNLTIQNYNFTGPGLKNGGGVRFEDFNGTGTIDSCIFKNNVSAGGGALYATTLTTPNVMDILLTNCLFSGNKADTLAGNGNGGAIVSNQSAGTTLNITINGESSSLGVAGDGNEARNGGAIFFEGTTLDIDDISIIDNVAQGSTSSGGGGIYMFIGNLYGDSITLTGNMAINGCGGGIYLGSTSSVALINKSIFGTLSSGNLAETGGGICGRGDSLAITSCEIINNEATANTLAGGGVFISASMACTMTNVEISNNMATSGGSEADG